MEEDMPTNIYAFLSGKGFNAFATTLTSLLLIVLFTMGAGYIVFDEFLHQQATNVYCITFLFIVLNWLLGRLGVHLDIMTLNDQIKKLSMVKEAVV